VHATLHDDLTAAIRAKDRVAVAALRSAPAAIDNARAVPVDQPRSSTAASEFIAGAAVGLGAAEAERRHLTGADLRSIVEHEVHERTVAADDFERAGRHDRAERLRAEAGVLSRYLGTTH
jgi:uncharacterized protein